MKTVVRLVVLAAVAGLGFWLWTVFFPAPEKVVLKKMTALAATATYGASDSNLIRAGKASNLVGMFAADAQIVVSVPELNRTLSGRDEIREAALGGFAGLSALKVEFLDPAVRLAPDKLTAEVSCIAKVVAGSSQDFGVQEMRFQFRKVEGHWLISRAETMKTLQ
jgi:hypothetical protein